MDLAKLRHIVAIADTGSFSRAAENQHITQPALSRSIAAFEARYGVRLFDRGRGGVEMTPVGSFVISQARILLDTAGELERSLRLYGKGAAGSVSFGLGPLMASLLLPRMSKLLLATRPNLQVVTKVKPADELLADLFSGAIEMIIGNGWLIRETPGVIAEPLGRADLAVIVRGSHPLTQQPAVSLVDLEAFPVARPIRLTSDAEATAGAFICDNFHILRETVLETDCVWISSPAFVAQDIQEGRLALLTVAGMELGTNQICVITRPGRTRSPAADVIVDLVKSMLREISNANGSA